MYWSLTTMITVGYGDIVPKNEFEVGICLITYMVGTVIFGYSLNCIGGLLNRMEEKNKELTLFSLVLS